MVEQQLSDAEMEIILAKFKTYGKQTEEIAGMSSFQRTHAVIPPPRRDRPHAITAAAAPVGPVGRRPHHRVAAAGVARARHESWLP